jgi:ABC-type phosphate/phosphonate transport system substrate-binding protein
MVRDAKADIAAIDAVTWRLIERYDNWAEQLRVLASTPATPGLPYICASAVDARLVADAVADAIGSLTASDQQALGLHGLVRISAADYLAVPSPGG